MTEGIKNLTGAQFARSVGADPVKWAQAFLVAYGSVDHVRTDIEREAFVASWFRDAMNAALGESKASEVQ